MYTLRWLDLYVDGPVRIRVHFDEEIKSRNRILKFTSLTGAIKCTQPNLVKKSEMVAELLLFLAAFFELCLDAFLRSDSDANRFVTQFYIRISLL